MDNDSLRTLVGLSLAACQSIERILVDAAPGSLRLEQVDVAEVAQSAATSAVLGGARVRTSFASDLPVILGDRVRVRQALDNLIENAVAAAGSDGGVELGIQATAHAVVVSVSDSGQGIPLEDQERIFEPGVRLDHPASGDPASRGSSVGRGAPGAAASGSGLGLAIVRAVAEAHGGRAQVKSVPGEGATFTLMLPIEGRQPAGVASSS